MPLNIDWQQILLHWMNLAILTGGLYFLLYKPVKGFMAKREAHYKELDEQAAEKLAQAERVQAEYQAKLDSMEEELRAERLQSQQAVQKSVEEQLAQAQAQAAEIIRDAQAQAEHSRDRIKKEAQRELKALVTEAAKKIAFQREEDPFELFLDLADGGQANESR